MVYTPPLTYQPQYQVSTAPQQPQQQMPQTNLVELVYVHGRVAAEAYPVAPGRNVWIIDLDSPNLYIKVTDQNGLPQKMREFEVKELGTETKIETETNVVTKSKTEDYVTRAELEKLLRKYQRKTRRNRGLKEEADE